MSSKNLGHEAKQTGRASLPASRHVGDDPLVLAGGLLALTLCSLASSPAGHVRDIYDPSPNMKVRLLCRLGEGDRNHAEWTA